VIIVCIFLLGKQSAFFNAAAILVVPLLDFVFKGKKLGLAGMASVALAMSGMGILQFGDSIASGAEIAFVPSDILCAMQAVFFGVGYWRLESSTQRFPAQAQRITLGTLLGLAVGAFTYSLAMGIVPPPEAIFLTLFHFPMITASLAWTGLGACAGAMYLETVALKAISATELTILMTSVSLFGAAFAYITMGETMTSSGMAGGALLLAGCLISSLMGEKGGDENSAMNFVPEEDDVNTLVLDMADVETLETATAFPTELGD
jgi:drug/metabolite transporter (DMT)-like permease